MPAVFILVLVNMVASASQVITEMDMTVNVTQAMLETEKSVMTSMNAVLHHAQPKHHAPTTMDLSLVNALQDGLDGFVLMVR